LDVLYVSLNAPDAYRRKALMGLDDYDRVAAVIDEGFKIVKGTKMRIVVKSVAGKDLFEYDEAERFISRWGGMWDKGGNAFMHLEGNWGGTTYPLRMSPRMGCMRALDSIMVLWDGRMSLCCFDGEGEVILGDLNTQTIREIYNGPLAVSYREAHAHNRRGELKLCASCTTI
jgi:hypothetical protein